MDRNVAVQSPSDIAHPGRLPSSRRMIRDPYIYGLIAITLLLVVIGAVNLLEVGIKKILLTIAGGDWVSGGPDRQNERLGFSIPFLIIATAIWYAHWRMVERSLQGPGAVLGRRSGGRSAYFMLVILIAGWSFFIPTAGPLQMAVQRLLGESLDAQEQSSVVSSLAIVIVVLSIWAFQTRIHVRDVRAETMESRSALTPQTGLYFIGLLSPAEHVSVVRRSYLCVVLGVGLVAMVIGLAFTAYQVMQVVLEVKGRSQLASTLARPLGVTTTAIVVVVAHGWMLRREMAATHHLGRGESLPGRELQVTLSGPEGGDIDAVLEHLRQQLPEGCRLS